MEKVTREKIRDGEDQRWRKSEDRVREKVGKSHCVFPMFCGAGGSTSRLAKAAGAEPAGQMKDEKLLAVVARSTVGSDKCQSTRCSDHFWKLRC